ncbi:hypothetical protein EVAR_39311_1 [Eumeta japonica]|uniref:Uncharacterized protein n=1 Tax=Eumeta variegata TaxID=151549 RepID=A0A4C1VWT2_EUMVA|nr:hypothetical protein EVAR_39311_1 [Eumeta japonica]
MITTAHRQCSLRGVTSTGNGILVEGIGSMEESEAKATRTLTRWTKHNSGSTVSCPYPMRVWNCTCRADPFQCCRQVGHAMALQQYFFSSQFNDHKLDHDWNDSTIFYHLF